jgi:SnoaL-like domain
MSRRATLEEVYGLWGRGDYGPTHFLHPDFELVFAPGFLEEGAHHGREDAWRAWRGWLDQWSSWTYEPGRWIDLDDGSVAVVITIIGVSRSTGMELSIDSGNWWQFEDDLVRRLTLYAHPEQMIAQLGLGDA